MMLVRGVFFMIAKLKGIVDVIGDDYVVIDVNGVGYLVFCSVKTLSHIPRVGEFTSLFTETIVREDSITLYGFLKKEEQAWFNALTKVQGVGVKAGLAILSVATPFQLQQSIMAGDKTIITQAHGVGPKVATRVVTEMKDKAIKIPVTSEVEVVDSETGEITEVKLVEAQEADVSSEDIDGLNDAVSALTNLGYQKFEAYKMVSSLVSKNKDLKTEKLIKLALVEFAKRG